MKKSSLLVFSFVLLTGLLIAGCSENKPLQKQQIQTAVHSMFENGKMVVLWEVDNQMDFRRQLGLIPD